MNCEGKTAKCPFVTQNSSFNSKESGRYIDLNIDIVPTTACYNKCNEKNNSTYNRIVFPTGYEEKFIKIFNQMKKVLSCGIGIIMFRLNFNNQAP